MGLYTLIWFTLQNLTAADDPAPGVFKSKDSARRYECERLDVEAAHRQYPGQVAAPGPRGDYVERSALVCSERLVRPGLRSDQDEAILYSLEEHTSELSQLATSLHPELESSTWLVEAYYPSTEVAAKLSFATKNALVAQGLRVSDRSPILGFDDIDVITRMPPFQAYPAACSRYFANGSLGEDDALLGLVLLDPRETLLHAGLCTGGSWTWLQ